MAVNVFPLTTISVIGYFLKGVLTIQFVLFLHDAHFLAEINAVDFIGGAVVKLQCYKLVCLLQNTVYHIFDSFNIIMNIVYHLILQSSIALSKCLLKSPIQQQQQQSFILTRLFFAVCCGQPHLWLSHNIFLHLDLSQASFLRSPFSLISSLHSSTSFLPLYMGTSSLICQLPLPGTAFSFTILL